MNDLIRLTEHFYAVKASAPGPTPLPPGIVNEEKINFLIERIKQIQRFWINNDLITKVLVSVEYREVIAKSNRVKTLFRQADQKIKGSKFITSSQNSRRTQMITYLLAREELERAISELSLIRNILTQEGGFERVREKVSQLTEFSRKEKKTGKEDFKEEYKLSIDQFVKFLRDVYYIENFHIPLPEIKLSPDGQLIAIYDIEEDVKAIFQRLNISYTNLIESPKGNLYELEFGNVQRLMSSAPYLISMSSDKTIQRFSKSFFINNLESAPITLPEPSDEPEIGVIDTPFNRNVSFGNWVTNENLLSKYGYFDSEATKHGTAVSSILVCGHILNPELNDNCGLFKVRHFEVGNKNINYCKLIQQIKKIVWNNPTIKVWNLSLGSEDETDPNCISLLASELDSLQKELDIIFVVAGTNKTNNSTIRIGSPADSINALVVNAVGPDNKAASYSRSGPVLSYFCKPDVACFGGDGDKGVVVVDGTSPNGKSDSRSRVYGTSFAAPWIARKLAFLIYKMKLRKEEAKALLLDSTQKWEGTEQLDPLLGHGVVPKKIEDVLYSQNDEIKIIISGVSESYETKTLTIPVPSTATGFPFVARITLSYSPNCDRFQGVDYTNTELDIHFGRCYVGKNSNGSVLIKSINHNLQSEEGPLDLKEKEVRDRFQKWNNVKIAKEKFSKRVKERKKYNEFWGLSIKRKERVYNPEKEPLPFSVVITLKEITGQNRFQQFFDYCQLQNKVVTRFNIHVQSKLKVQEEQEVQLD